MLENYIGIVILILLFFIVYKTYKIYVIRKKYGHIPGPKTNGLLGFYLGNLDEALKYLKGGKILADMMLDLSKKHGSVFKFQILDKIVVFTINQNAVKEVLITENFPKIPEIYNQVGFPYNERYLGNGLLSNTDSESWKKRRNLFNNGFHRNILMNSIEEFNTKVDSLLVRLRLLSDGCTKITLFKEINHMALDVIASIAFGMNTNSINDPKNELNHYVYESLKGFYRQTFEPFIIYNPLEWKFLYNYKQIIRKLRDLGRKQILKRILNLQNGNYVADDILTNLLKNHVDEKFNVDNMVDDFLTFFVAGQETTANTLAFCMLELGRNPHVVKKLREEVDSVLGSKSYISYEDVAKLTYTNCVYKETLRMWPPIPEIARISDKEIEINGLKIPPKTWIQVSTYVSGRYEEYFEEPEKFLPERFLFNAENTRIKNYTYFPFSLGARNCIGQNFAQLVGKIFIAKFVQNFDMTLDWSQNLGVIQEATLRPADGTQCYLLPRKN
uniref:Cytochrome p450 CYP3049F2 n=1 Tax=Brachionus calyciflorus TaxID=104777 RepID=A0A2H4PSK0_9BILA|nr:cytochrome p450 CYP3049F2 [Brachionus calyciflorus]